MGSEAQAHRVAGQTADLPGFRLQPGRRCPLLDVQGSSAKHITAVLTAPVNAVSGPCAVQENGDPSPVVWGAAARLAWTTLRGLTEACSDPSGHLRTARDAEQTE